MRSRRRLVLLVAIFLLPSLALARDSHLKLPIKEALATVTAEGRIADDVKLYFGGQKHPAIERVILGSVGTNKKTNAFNKSDEEACRWAFLSAILALQARARAEGGDAVVEIKSNYRNVPFASDTEYECGAGALMAGVAFTGKIVKLK